MSASLVGSEMCIRDRATAPPDPPPRNAPPAPWRRRRFSEGVCGSPTRRREHEKPLALGRLTPPRTA
eukprot:1051221-Alexandrium_andersonii.AAC.1